MDTESTTGVYTKLNRIAEIARSKPREKFLSLAHLLNEQFLTTCFYELNRNAAAGIDKQDWIDYEKDLSINIEMLVERMKAKQYRAQDIRRVWIPKPDGGERPLGILTIEDKIVQRGTANILNAIYEQDFLDSSYGFREGRSCHEALKAVELMVMKDGVNYLLDVDIKGYFDNINHEWLMKMIEERVVDTTIKNLIGKWLKVGVLEEGKRTEMEEGTPQGGVISPLLANIYLHYTLDLWLEKHIAPRMKGKVKLVRYADDFVIGCSNEEDAKAIWKLLPERLAKFGLMMSKEKSRMIEFGKKAFYEVKRGNGKEQGTFDFLGFTHYMKYSRKGKACVGRKTIGKRMRRKLKEINTQLKEWRNKMKFSIICKKLRRVLSGYYNYYGFAGNTRAITKFHFIVVKLWFKWLNRRSQKRSFTWEEFNKMLERYPLVKPKIVKTYAWIYS